MNALDLLVLLVACGVAYDWWYYKGKHAAYVYGLRRHAKMAGMVAMAVLVYMSMRQSPAHAGKSVISMLGMMSKTQIPWTREGMHTLAPVTSLLGLSPSSPSSSSLSSPPPSATGRPTKRAVSETKKKYVASQQGWTCKHCGAQLTHTFEVDHILGLEHGGSNDASNLVALCRECHGQKTALSHM